MEEKNKLFTNLLVYGFLIFLTVPLYRTLKYMGLLNISEDYTQKDSIESVESKVSEIRSKKSPRENYINPNLTCTYENANYESVRNSVPYQTRYCVNVIKKSLYKVGRDDVKEHMGELNKTIYHSNGSTLGEYTIENNELIEYYCKKSGSSCNGQSKRYLKGYKRN